MGLLEAAPAFAQPSWLIMPPPVMQDATHVFCGIGHFNMKYHSLSSECDEYLFSVWADINYDLQKVIVF